VDCALRDAAARAWPPLEARRIDGWLLRSTPDVPRGRLNSGLPLRADPDLAPLLDFYAERGQPPQVQLTPIGGHPRLAAQLDAAGWREKWPSAVLRAPGGAVAGESGRVPPAAAPAAGSAAAVELLGGPEARWLAAWAACEGRDDVEAHARIVLARLPGRVAYALIEPARAVGLAVHEGERVGLFCVAVHPAHRRAGLGTAVVRALVAWSGAREAYLEVEQRNAPALALYRRLGFTTAYDYVHRIAP
jgi:ribosomal protein S18 acetylase RimI-like enzyme